MSTLKTRSRRVVAAMSVSLTACGDASAPKPVASVDALSGESTAINLDAGFAKALKKLELTPGVVGRGTLVKGSEVFRSHVGT